MVTKLLKLPDVKSRVAHSKSVIYARIKEGLMPPPIRVGTQSSAWVEHEIEAFVRARIAGKSDAELRALVTDLVTKRKQAA